MSASPPWYVLTGGPCAGKTTTINEIARRGYPVLAEAARLIIDEKLAAGHTIQEIVGDPGWLSSVVRRSYAQESVMPRDEIYFLDRALPDSIAYHERAGRDRDDFFNQALKEAKYRKVFLLDLVDFENDSARSETPEEAKALHESLRQAYEGQGYSVIQVPVMPVVERADFILGRVNLDS